MVTGVVLKGDGMLRPDECFGKLTIRHKGDRHAVTTPLKSQLGTGRTG